MNYLRRLAYGMSITVMLLSFSACQTTTKDVYNTETPIITQELVGTETNDKKEATPSSWIDDATIYEVNLRQYTTEGTIQAFIPHLDRLQEMGVEILWFMPIHPISKVERKGLLGSYYAVADYKGVNPEFGTMDEFVELVDKAHDMGFKVILDWVPNHTGWDHPWITEHPEWYTQVDGEITHPIGTDWTDVADLNYDQTDMREAMVEAMSYWIEEVDIDGYRCDVAGQVPEDFWNEASARLNILKPVFMLAEDGSNYDLLNEAFDANYNWNLMGSMNNSVSGSSSANALKSDLVRIQAYYPEGSFPMNFVTNHDENSWNGTAYERLGDGKDMMEALIFTAPGMPLIYSGQEASLNKRLLFFEKDEIDWTDLSHQDFLKDLITLKKDNPALFNGRAGGDLEIINTTDKQILSFLRTKDTNKVIYIGNLSNEETTFKLKGFDAEGSYETAFTGEKMILEEGTEITLEGFSFVIYTAK